MAGAHLPCSPEAPPAPSSTYVWTYMAAGWALSHSCSGCVCVYVYVRASLPSALGPSLQHCKETPPHSGCLPRAGWTSRACGAAARPEGPALLRSSGWSSRPMDDPGIRHRHKIFCNICNILSMVVACICCMYLLVEDHVHTMWSDIMCKLAQEGEDVLYARCVGQPPQPQTVPYTTRRGQEWHCGQHWHQGGRGNRYEGGRRVPIQHLKHKELHIRYLNCSRNAVR